MTLTLRLLETTNVVCIGEWDPPSNTTLGHTIVPDLDTNRSGSCRISVEMANLSTKQSSLDGGSVARLSISTRVTL